MAGNVALTGDDLTYDLDSRSAAYFRSHAWPIQMDQVVAPRPDPRRNISPIQTTSHGLRQTTMAEHPMMDTWRFQQQHQQQQQQHHHHHHQLHQHHQQLQHHAQYQHVHQHQQTQQQPSNVDYTTSQQAYD